MGAPLNPNAITNVSDKPLLQSTTIVGALVALACLLIEQYLNPLPGSPLARGLDGGMGIGALIATYGLRNAQGRVAIAAQQLVAAIQEGNDKTKGGYARPVVVLLAGGAAAILLGCGAFSSFKNVQVDTPYKRFLVADAAAVGAASAAAVAAPHMSTPDLQNLDHALDQLAKRRQELRDALRQDPSGGQLFEQALASLESVVADVYGYTNPLGASLPEGVNP
jgi:hypothetical protein